MAVVFLWLARRVQHANVELLIFCDLEDAVPKATEAVLVKGLVVFNREQTIIGTLTSIIS